MSLRQVPSAIGGFDLVVCSTAAAGAVLRRQNVADPLKNLSHPIVIVDIAVPRDVDPALEGLSRVRLYNIDHLNHIIERARERRCQEIPKARAIVAQEARKFGQWWDTRKVVPTIKLLKERLHQMQETELRRHGKNLDSADREKLKRFAHSLCQKFLHGPITYLQEVAINSYNGEHLAAVETVEGMYGLNGSKQSSE